MKRKAMEIDKHKIERREGRGGAGYSPASGMVFPPSVSPALRRSATDGASQAPCCIRPPKATARSSSKVKEASGEAPFPRPRQCMALQSGPALNLDVMSAD